MAKIADIDIPRTNTNYKTIESGNNENNVFLYREWLTTVVGGVRDKALQ